MAHHKDSGAAKVLKKVPMLMGKQRALRYVKSMLLIMITSDFGKRCLCGIWNSITYVCESVCVFKRFKSKF